MLYTIKGWKLDIDFKKTAQYYADQNKEEFPECCNNCKNYWHGIEKVCGHINTLFSDLKISPIRTANVSELTECENGAHLYEASYLITGRILAIAGSKETIDSGGVPLSNLTELCEEASINFSDTLYVPDGIYPPEPLIELDIICEVPWVLDVKPIDDTTNY
jgi:hypothetical protein